MFSVVWKWQLKTCTDACKGSNDNQCCVLVCAYRALKVIYPEGMSQQDKQSFSPIEGFIGSFLLSVGNSTVWKPVLKSAADYCNEVIEKTDEVDDCDINWITWVIFIFILWT
jgi:hypothetical protein